MKREALKLVNQATLPETVEVDLLEQFFGPDPTPAAPPVTGPSPALKETLARRQAEHAREIAREAPSPPAARSAPNHWPTFDIAADPRPDLVEDSARWARLLGLTREKGGDGSDSLVGALNGLRCAGLRCWPAAGGGVRLARGFLDEQGVVVEATAWITEQQYADWRTRFLAPHAGALVALLREMR